MRHDPEDEAELASQLQLAIDTGRLGIWLRNFAEDTAFWDPRMEELAGLEPGGFGGTWEAFREILHPDDVDRVLETIRKAVEDLGRYTLALRVIRPDGSIRWIEGQGQVLLDSEGHPTGTIGFAADVTERVEAEERQQELTRIAVEAAEQERRSRERIEFLWHVNEAVSSARTRDAIMASVARTAVPRLGDWCFVCVLNEGNPWSPELVASHVDPRMVTLSMEYREIRPWDPQAEYGLAAVIRTGEPEFYPVITDEMRDASAITATERRLVRQFDLRSVIVVPLLGPDGAFGALEFARSDLDRPFTEEDLSLAQAVAGRVASALENARLSDHQRQIATLLQSSLLPGGLPKVPQLDVAIRYWATGEGTEVGGDFYDLFAVGDDQWAVTIGDVCGVGPAAAALTGLARHTLRSAAWHGDEPDAALRHLNVALAAAGTESFCTAIFGSLQPVDAGFDFRFAVGGHPLPLYSSQGASVRSVGVTGTLLGVFPDAASTVTTLRLSPGDTLILFTDGITDVAAPHGLRGDQLEAIVNESLATTDDAESLADALHGAISAILPLDRRSDDIAILILRAT